jgi:hypothetical protein
MTEAVAPRTDDPRPQPPAAPAPGDCCGEGCANCVHDLHEQAMLRYREWLAAWQARHPGDTPAGAGDQNR